MVSPSAARRFEGKVAFVTGGASGIGEGGVRRFDAEGARVAVADINLDAAKRLADELTDGLAVQIDVSDADSVRQAVAATVEHFGRLDVVFNNAGITDDQKSCTSSTSRAGTGCGRSTATASSTS